MLYFTLVAE